MKKTLIRLGIGAGIAILVLHFSEPASACSPPPPTYAQQDDLLKVMKSEAFQEALKLQTSGHMYISIKSIDFDGAVNVHLSNDCTIKGMVEYNYAIAPGLCPTFKGVKTETICKN